MEVVTEGLEEKGREIAENISLVYGNNVDLIPKEILNLLYFRDLPITPQNFGKQKIIEKKRFDSLGVYTQVTQTRMAKLYRLKDIREFKNFCRQMCN